MKDVKENTEQVILTPEEILERNSVSTQLCQEIISVRKLDRANQKFYNSKEWKRARAMTIARDDGMDVWEYLISGRIVYPETVSVHHIESLIESPDMRCNLDNLVTVSQESHRQIEALYNKGNKDLVKSILKAEVHKRNAQFYERQQQETKEPGELEQLTLFSIEGGDYIA